MRTVLLINTTLLFTGILYGQVEGPKNGSTFQNISLSGSNQSWVNVNDVATSNSVYASFGNISAGVGAYTDYLVVTNFNFSIPLLATISGIVVEMQRSDPNSRTADHSIRIVKSGTIGSTERSGGAAYSFSPSYQTFGNAGDLWGETWTASEINDAGFGVAIAAKRIVSGGTTGGQVDHLRIIVFYDFSTLPVKLLSFTSSNSNKIVKLEWTTTDEENMVNYEIERSVNGRDFTILKTVFSNNNLQISHYSVDDNDPIQGISYYRLKMNGRSGYIKYSNIIKIEIKKENSLSLYPNIVQSGQRIFIKNGDDINEILFFDASGNLSKKIITNSVELNADLLSLQKGLYYYKIFNAEGQLQGSGRIVLQ
jgi:hypothetical protein